MGTRILLPLGFLAALWQAELFAAASRGRLLERLGTRPTLEQWRNGIAAALDDPPLQIGYWDIASASFRDADGAEVVSPPAGSGRRSVPADRDGGPWRR
ncbi:MAG TPA: hypothetical protein VFP78_09040 [Solirubrobacteraceae bacterium]|nr:hypothetical protein [Solirubrobacteraceae bacterium]